jgi:hypothetical protein
MARACGTHGEKKNRCRMLVGKFEGKRPVERPRHRWEYEITIYFKEIELEGLDWIYLS